MLLAGRLDAMASTEHSLLFAMYSAGIDVAHHALQAEWVRPLQQTREAMRRDGNLNTALYQNKY